MRAKSMILIFVALVCGLAASLGISQALDMNKGGASAEPTEQIFIATTDINIGAGLGAQNVKLEDWPRNRIPEGAIRDLADLENRFARTRFYKGEVIHTSKLMESNGGVVDSIPEGYRVCSARVNMETSVSGLVRPGDRVDIIAILRAGRDIPSTRTRVILRAVRVFAVNAETDRQVDKEGTAIDAKTVSMLVKDDQVGRLMLAMELGTLRLSLRGPKDELTENDDTSDDTTMDDLLGTNSEIADDVPLGGGGSLTELLNNTPQPAAVPTTALADMTLEPTGPIHRMEFHTPDGIRYFEWNSRDTPPEEVSATCAAVREDESGSMEKAFELDNENDDDTDSDQPDPADSPDDGSGEEEESQVSG